MSDWQPIETAPRDRTRVLLYGPYQWEDYQSDQRVGVVVGYFDAEDEVYGGSDRWVLESTNPYTDYCQPTHWMPLPLAPVACEPAAG